MFRAHGFGMELHPEPGPIAKAQSHDLIVITGMRGDFEVRRKCVGINNQGMVSHPRKILRHGLKNPPSVMVDGAWSPMPRLGPGKNAGAGIMGQTLMAEANSQYGKCGEKLEQIPAYPEVARVLRMSGTGREYGRIQISRPAGQVLPRQFIVAVKKRFFSRQFPDIV